MNTFAVSVHWGVSRTAEMGKGPPHSRSSTVASFRIWRGSRRLVGEPTGLVTRTDAHLPDLVPESSRRSQISSAAANRRSIAAVFVQRGAWATDEQRGPLHHDGQLESSAVQGCSLGMKFASDDALNTDTSHVLARRTTRASVAQPVCQNALLEHLLILDSTPIPRL